MLTILLFIDCSKMARIRINPRTHTKEKPYLINSFFFSKFQKQTNKQKTKTKTPIGWAKYMYVCEWDMCWRNFCNFSLVTKNVKRMSKMTLFFKWAPFWNLISKKGKQLHFSEVNYLNFTKKTQFCMWLLHFP